jgi:hypothetical protein
MFVVVRSTFYNHYNLRRRVIVRKKSVTYIVIESSKDAERSAFEFVGHFGPYSNADEAKKHLRENGWQDRTSSYDDCWNNWDSDKQTTIGGLYAIARVKVLELMPRNQLPDKR